MKKLLLALLIICISSPALAGTTVVEGAEAEKLFAAQKGYAKILVQQNKKFILRVSGKETKKPKTLTVKANEVFFITNEEEKYTHNVYDTSDSDWVLKKQKPSKVAALSFSEPGKHKLKCAIHPKMKITVMVE